MSDTRSSEARRIEPDEDPVCGMRVDPDAARARGLTHDHGGRAYVFCGKGCLLEFKDDPATYLAPGHQPSM